MGGLNMKLIKPSFEIWKQEPGLEGIYKQIEKAGRICYKSEDKITENSAKSFVDRMINSGHGAMLEHGTVYLYLNWPYRGPSPLSKYYCNPYSKVVRGYEIENKSVDHYDEFVTTNYRVLVEQGWLSDLQYLCEPTEFHEKRITVKFILSRSIAQEFTRHRVFSYSMESQRYCNYSSNKFNKEVTFIIPCWTKLKEGKYKVVEDIDYNGYVRTFYRRNNRIVDLSYEEEIFVGSLFDSECTYFNLLDKELLEEDVWKPQQAREVLSNACKTELVMTGFVNDWWEEYLVIDKSTDLIDQRIHGKFWTELDKIDKEKYRIVEKGFFPLRCSSGAHPQAQELAIPLREEFVKKGYVTDNK